MGIRVDQMVTKITKQDIVDHINKKFGLSKTLSKNFFEDICKEIVKITKEHGSLTITNFGKFTFKNNPYNIGTGYDFINKSSIKIKKSNKLKFRASSKLKSVINKIT